MRVVVFCYLASVLAAATLMALPRQEESPADELQQMQQSVEELRVSIRDIEQQLAKDPRNAGMWEGLFQQRSFLAAMEGAVQARMSGAEPPAMTPEEMRQRNEAWIAEWIAATPNEPRAHVFRANVIFAEQPEARSEALRDVAARFPDDFQTQVSWARDLSYRGAGAEAAELMNAYAARHPTVEAFEWLYSHYQEAEPAKADEVLDRWLARYPDDPQALQTSYHQRSYSMSAEERHAAAADLAARLPPKDASHWCHSMFNPMERTGFERAVACYDRLFARTEPSGEDHDQVLYSYATMAGSALDLDRFEEAARELPQELRESATTQTAHSFFYRGQCDQGVALVRASGVPLDNALSIGNTDPPREPPCVRTESFRGLVADAIAASDLSVLGVKVRQFSPWMPAEAIEAALLRRLAKDPKERIVYQSLDDLYRNGDLRASAGSPQGAPEQRRIAALERWLRADGGSEAAMRLSEALVMTGNNERAMQVLEALVADPEAPPSYLAAERLAGFYALAGRWDDAAALGQRILARGDAQAYEGHLLLAEVALAREDMTTALGHYERFFDAADPHDWKRAETYKYVLASLDDGERLVGFLEGLWEKSLAKGVRFEGTREEWIAAELEKAGALEEALAYYERRLAAGPLPPSTLRQIAELAEDAERWDLAERVRITWRDAAPTEDMAWAQLAEHYLARDQVDRAFTVLEQAFARVPVVGPTLWILWADALLGSPEKRETVPIEDLVEAIKVLEDGKANFPDNVWARYAVDEKLIELYTLLGQRDVAKAPATAP